MPPASPPATLAERIGFDSASLAPAADESARHDRLVADSERLGPVNLVAESELAELEGARETNAAERDELYQAVNRLRGSIGSLNREGRQRLLGAFEAVDIHYRRLFATLFAGGEAHLALIDSDDPLEAGLETMAQPPGKTLGSLTLLSDGEQTSGDKKPLAAAATAKKLGVPVNTIALGTREAVVEVPVQKGLKERVVVTPDPKTLQAVARITGGKYATAPTAERLKQVYKDLGTKVVKKKQTREVTAAFAGFGVVLLLVASGLSLAWSRRPL